MDCNGRLDCGRIRKRHLEHQCRRSGRQRLRPHRRPAGLKRHGGRQWFGLHLGERPSSFFVGLSGTGSLTVSNGGAVSSLYGLIGDFQGSTGSVTVKGAGLAVGQHRRPPGRGRGTGSLAILDQGEVRSGSSSIGTFANSIGTATVDGSGSRWLVNGDLVVGESGSGTLNINAGGLVGSTYGYVGYQTALNRAR